MFLGFFCGSYVPSRNMFVSWYWVLWVMACYFLLPHTGTFLNRNLKDFGENENTRKT
jgi:hypothetical protein